MSVTILMERVGHRRACEILGVHPTTLYRWTAEGRLTRYRVGNRLKYSLDELERFLERCEERGTLAKDSEVA